MNPFAKPKEDSVTLSLPQSRKVRGYQVRRLPLGEFLKAMEALQNAPGEALEAVFPELGLEGMLGLLKTADSRMLGALLAKAMTTLPRQALALVAALTLIPAEQLLDDPAIGLDGLVEMAEAWMEVNRIENFMQAAARLMQKVRAAARAEGPTGSSGLSPTD